jgi:NADH dehydrogenase FAD-containing subunit
MSRRRAVIAVSTPTASARCRAHPRTDRDLGGWCGGSPLARTLGTPAGSCRARRGRSDLGGAGRADVTSVIGDLAAVSRDGKPVPASPRPRSRWAGTSRFAIRRALASSSRVPFRFTATGASRRSDAAEAVGEMLGGLKLSGNLAWIAWLAIPSSS